MNCHVCGRDTLRVHHHQGWPNSTELANLLGIHEQTLTAIEDLKRQEEVLRNRLCGRECWFIGQHSWYRLSCTILVRTPHTVHVMMGQNPPFTDADADFFNAQHELVVKP